MLPPRTDDPEGLLRETLRLHGEGLEKLLGQVHEALGERSPAFFERLCEDPLLEHLLCLHGLHPIPLAERVQAALEGVRPYLKSHTGDVAVERIEDGIVHLRLAGTCDGCPSSSSTVKNAVERAILERVPEIRGVQAEGTPEGAKHIDLTVLAIGV